MVEAARTVGSLDFEMACRAVEGLALVAGGRVPDGMRGLDAAVTAAVAGEVETIRIVEVICCHLLDACRRVRDLERARERCVRVEEIAGRYGDVEMFATCRTHYADLLIWRGEWQEAEETLTSACRDLGSVPRKVTEGIVRLAELHRRQGRLDQAEALLAEAGAHRLVPLVRAAIQLDRGDARAVAEEAERFLRRVGEADRFERVPGLELLVCGAIGTCRVSAAERAVEELEQTSAQVGTAPLRAAALVARGRLSVATAPETACSAFEDGIELYVECGACYEAARARLELADVMRALGRDAGAKRVEAEARRALAALGAPVAEPPAARGLLTPREREVLQLVAQGRSNDAIASVFVVSVRTVERHVENIYDKIGVSGRPARAAATAWAFAHGVA